MDNRDLVQDLKIWDEYNGNKKCFISVSKSIEQLSCPPQKKIVRAKMIISGMF